MTKRIGGPRHSAATKDLITTPAEPVRVLVKALGSQPLVYAELCAGDGRLISHLKGEGHICGWAADIAPRAPGIERLDASLITSEQWEERPEIEVAISNPPYSRHLAVPILTAAITWPVTSWWLVPLSWLGNQWFRPFAPHVRHLAVVGRIRWIEGSKHKSSEDYVWIAIERTPAEAALGAPIITVEETT